MDTARRASPAQRSLAESSSMRSTGIAAASFTIAMAQASRRLRRRHGGCSLRRLARGTEGRRRRGRCHAGLLDEFFALENGGDLVQERPGPGDIDRGVIEADREHDRGTHHDASVDDHGAVLHPSRAEDAARVKLERNRGVYRGYAADLERADEPATEPEAFLEH